MSLPSWLWIPLGMVLIGVGCNRFLSANNLRWFNRLQRPQWLTFERLIPLIWTVVFIGVGWSAVLIWNQNPGSANSWILLGYYLVLELVTLSYTPIMCRLESLRAGTLIGATGWLLAILLAIAIQPRSTLATVLLFPYLIWSPIGTYTTWAMIQLNPDDA
ncbi:MAG: TspO protein [Phormidium sp. GEM2.Bin31]|nr:MAG: TspO protein [Phormidium sp. GEM2.Bin31]